jgi:DNA-binding IclR family transcriptional regulator
VAGDEPRGVAAKVCAVLDAIGVAPAGLSATEVARHTGMPLSTAHRLVQALAGWGGLERQPDGRYRAGLRLWGIAASAPRAGELRIGARPFLEDLSEATRHNVQLAVLDGGAALVVEHYATRDAVPTATRIGGRLPLHASGVGQVLLAHAPSDEQAAVLAGPLKRYTARTITRPEALRRVIAEVRRTGVAITENSMPLPARAVAAPVSGPGGQVIAAVSVVVPSAGMPTSAYVPAVIATARGVSRALSRTSATPSWSGRAEPAGGPSR